MLKTYLVRKNYDTHISHTLAEGVKQYTSLKPDILFIDNNLPDGTGWDFAIKNLLPQHKTRLFFISAYHPILPEIPPGIDYTVIEKPVSFFDLDNKLGDVLK
ncbi:MAG TPA: hypothetical protein VEB40_00535 [Flavipsychrobacter sp.]|nr:hypothetical protein [Flavipsychrobacter sp.]